MSAARNLVTDSHVVDILGSTRGRDQPIMLVERALQLATAIDIETFADPNVVFFDPFCKAGEVLLALAMHTCAVKRKTSRSIVSQVDVEKELYGGRYFALAPDERHYLLSIRTFFGNSRSHDANQTQCIRNGNYLSEIDGRLNNERFQQEFNGMLEFIKKNKPESKIVTIGNPPYQEADGGAKASAKPIYNFFVDALIDSNKIDEFALVIPARWFSGGKNLQGFRDRIAGCGQIKTLEYFEHAEDVFPTVHIQGGVCFLHWKKDFQGEATFIYKSDSFKIDLSKFDIIPDDPESASIIDKVMTSKVKQSVADIAWSRKPFGLPTFYFQRNDEASETADGAIKCLYKGKKFKNILRSKIRVNADKIEKWKVAIPRAYATGARRCTLPKHQIFLLKKGEVTTETYNVVGCFDTKAEAESLINYLQTDFCRYLLGVRKLTQDIPKDRWSWVPLVDLSKTWTDEKLFEFFNLSKREQLHLRKKVKEWS